MTPADVRSILDTIRQLQESLNERLTRLENAMAETPEPSKPAKRGRKGKEPTPMP